MNDRADLPNVEIGVSVKLPDGMPGPDVLGTCMAQSLSVVLKRLHPGCSQGNIELGILIVSDTGIRSLNLRHRGVDSATDVLSFPLLENSEKPDDPTWDADSEPVSLGDIVLSAETIARQAEERGMSFIERISECLVHGILHVLGYNHDTDYERARMEKLEDSMVPEVMGKLEI